MRLTAKEKEWNRMVLAEKEFLLKGNVKKETKLNQLLAEKVPDNTLPMVLLLEISALA